MPDNLVLLIMFLTVVKFPWEGVQMKASWQSVTKPEEALFTTPFVMELRCVWRPLRLQKTSHLYFQDVPTTRTNANDVTESNTYKQDDKI